MDLSLAWTQEVIMAKKNRKQLDKQASRSQLGNHTGTTRTYGMHIVTRQKLTAFGKAHADADVPLRDWIRIFTRKQYRTPAEVKRDFSSVDFVEGSKAVFNICGNKYRLVVGFVFEMGRVFVRHVVTHKEYDLLIKRGLL